MCWSFLQALGSSSGPAFKILSWLCQPLLSGFCLRLHWSTYPSLSSWYQTHFTPLSSVCFVSSHLSIMTNKAQFSFPKNLVFSLLGLYSLMTLFLSCIPPTLSYQVSCPCYHPITHFPKLSLCNILGAHRVCCMKGVDLAHGWEMMPYPAVCFFDI